MKTTLDQRQNSVFEWILDAGSIGTLTFANLSQLDTDYTLVLDEGLPTEQSYSVGNGITLDSPTSSVNWSVDTTGWESKTYTGDLKSNSMVLGIYFKVKLEVHLS